MAEFFAREARFLDPTQATNAVRSSARESNGHVYVVKATINLATINGGTAVANGDTIVLGALPLGRSFLFGQITTSATLGTSTVAIGPRAAPTTYRAAATFTATNTPTNFGVATTLGAGPTTDEGDIVLTVGAANLPTTGTVVVTLYYVGV